MSCSSCKYELSQNCVSSNIVFVCNKEIGKVIDIPYCSHSNSKTYMGNLLLNLIGQLVISVVGNSCNVI